MNNQEPGFPRSMIDLLRCQKDKSPLSVGSVEHESSDQIVEGLLKCDACGQTYPVQAGIVDLLGGQEALDAVASNEAQSRDQEALIYDDEFYMSARDKLECDAIDRHLGDYSKKTIVDLGCGTGRLTERLAGPANRVLAIDFSRASLKVLAGKIQAGQTVGMVLADATQVTLSPDSFGAALSAQVIEHVPTAERRVRFFEGVGRVLMDDGTFVCTAYHYDLRSRLKGDSQEGFHSSNIFFHHFTVSELKREAAQALRLVDIHPIQIFLPIIHRLPFGHALISSVAEHIPIINQFGRLVMFKGHKKVRV